MTARATQRLFEDTWIQVFGLLSLLSAVFCAHFFFQPYVSNTAIRSLLAAGTNPPATNRWVVDPKRGPGSNIVSLHAAVAAAADGDVIELRPGVYDEHARLSKSLVILGSGAKPEDVIITGVIEVSRGQTTFEKLTLPQLRSTKARLVLRHVRVRSPTTGVRLVDSDAEVVSSDIEGKPALWVSGESKANLSLSFLTSQGDGSALLVDGAGAYAGLDGCRIRSQGNAVQAGNSSLAWLRDVDLSAPSGSAITISSRAQARVARGLIANSRYGVEFQGPGALDVRNTRFEHLPKGAFAIKPALARQVTIRGAGNLGLAPKEESKILKD